MSTPLFLSASDAMALETIVFYKQLAEKLSAKGEEHYSLVMGWLCYRICFALLAVLLCVFIVVEEVRGHPV